VLSSRNGYREVRVAVVGTTRKHWRVHLLERATLPRGVFECGAETLVPHRAVYREGEERLFNPQLELELKQLTLPTVQRSTVCPDCDRRALEGLGRCSRHVTPSSSGKHGALGKVKP